MSMVLFPPSVLAQMRALNEANLPHSCQVLESTTTKAEGGTHVESWTPVGVYPARMTPVSQDEQVVADQATGAAQWRVALPAGTPVDVKHRLVVSGIDAAGVGWVKTLDVIAVAGPRAGEMMRTVIGLEAWFSTLVPVPPDLTPLALVELLDGVFVADADQGTAPSGYIVSDGAGGFEIDTEATSGYDVILVDGRPTVEVP